MTSFVPRDKSLRAYFPAVGDDLYGHRMRLKMYLMRTSPLECPSCGEIPIIVHMHEGIISREETRGLDAEQKVLVHTPYNCILLCGSCNWGLDGKAPPAREQVLEWKCAQYGEEEIARWLRSLPYKVHPLRGWLERHV